MAQNRSEDREFGSPFLYTTVEDLLIVNSTRFWRNSNVRVLGKVSSVLGDSKDLTFESPVLTSNVRRIKLNVEILNYDLPLGRLLEIFGYMDVQPRQQPILTVLFYRNLSGISITSYYKAIRLRNQYIPQFNDEDDEMPLSPAQSSDINDKIPNSPGVMNTSPSLE